MVVLDTDHVSLLEHGDSPLAQRLRSRLADYADTRLVTTIISYEEQVRGWMSSLAQARNLSQQLIAYRRLKRHLDNYRDYTVLEFDELAATEFQRLRKQAPRVGTMDLKIAAITLANKATLLSRNLSDFQRVPGLPVEDWTI
jgi:tRNA(fMet)-specific endonuclease VapC